jgi:hypothetical protein
MSLAKLLATSIARLYAYAMAPDDHTEEERREIIDQADKAIDVANTVVWFEDLLQGSEHPPAFGVLEAMVEAKRIANQPTSQPEVDERNSDCKNHDEGTTP